MNNNVFFSKNKKFNPDILNKFTKKKLEREKTYKYKNYVDKPIIKSKIVVDTPKNLKQRQYQMKKERQSLDSFILQKKNINHQTTHLFNYNTHNILRPKNNSKSSKKTDKILEDLKKLGILK